MIKQGQISQIYIDPAAPTVGKEMPIFSETIWMVTIGLAYINSWSL